MLGQCEGQASHESASKIQSAALIAIIKKSEITLDERATLSSLVTAVPWYGSDLNAVMAALVPPVQSSRKKMQNFVALPEYFAEHEWEQLQDPEAPVNHKRDFVLNRSTQLSLRCPSEPTTKYLTSFLIVCSSSPRDLQTMTGTQKQETLRHFKQQFKTYGRRLSEPATYVETLPATPGELKRLHADLCKTCYPEGSPPVKAKVDLMLVQGVDVSFRCRGSGVEANHVTTLSLPSASSTDHLFSQAERFANSMMDNMWRMQQQQQQLMSAVMGNGSGQQPRSLGILAGMRAASPLMPLSTRVGYRPAFGLAYRPQSLQSLPSAGPEIGALPDDGFAEEVVQTPSGAIVQVVAKAAAAVVAPEAPAPIAAPEVPTPTVAQVAPTESVSGVTRLLSLLDQRDADKKRAKKEGQSPTNVLKKTAAAGPIDSDQVVTKPSSKAYFTVERSRSQVMCRTGLGGPGSTHKIKFGAGEMCKSEAEAVSAAKQWVAEH